MIIALCLVRNETLFESIYRYGKSANFRFGISVNAAREYVEEMHGGAQHEMFRTITRILNYIRKFLFFIFTI